MNGLLIEGSMALALSGVLAWGGSGLRAKVRADRQLREERTPAEASGILRALVMRQLTGRGAHIEISRVAYYDDDGVIYAARHYALVPGPETDATFTASREAKRLTDPRYALPAPLVPPAGFRPALLTRIPWSSLVGHVEGLPDVKRERTTAQLRAIHREGSVSA